MAARPIPAGPIRPLERALPPALALLLALLPSSLATVPALARPRTVSSLSPGGIGTHQVPTPTIAAALSAQAYPLPPRQAVDPLAICPDTLLTFLNNSTNRVVPLWIAARSCDCYAQERAQGNQQESSSRRCFP